MNVRTDREAGSPCCPASGRIAAMEDALRRHSGQLGDIRGHALAVAGLSWESPAGMNFRSYLAERCAELVRTMDLLESAALQLADYRRLIHDAELLQHQAGL